MPYQGEKVTQAIKEHQTSPVTGWEYGELVRELHAWCDRVDKDFNLGVPTPVIAIAPLPRNVLGLYRLGRNEIGTRTTIYVNEGYVVTLSFSQIILVLIHELLHAWEEWRCGRERGGWYHTVEWRHKMAEVGIIADDHGATQQILPSFIDYLQRYGLANIRFPNDKSQGRTAVRRRQMPKWTCGCPTGNPARAVRLSAVCQVCHQLYRKVEW